MKKIVTSVLLSLVLFVSCKKEENNPSSNINNNNNNNNQPTDKRDMAEGKYDCKQYVFSKAGASMVLMDSAAFEIEIKKHATDTTKIEIYKGTQLFFNTNNVKTLTTNNKILTFDIPAQKMTYLNIERDVTGEPYFFTGSNYTHGGYVDSTKVCQFAVSHPGDYSGFTTVHRFNCVKK
jgi:PBP1b-binding outer membrane lipoprotein LpoB